MIQVLPRTFTYNNLTLDDPDPKMTPDEVKGFYAEVYPELTQAAIEGPEPSDTAVEYRFRRAVGTKGAGMKEPEQQPHEELPDFGLMREVASVLEGSHTGDSAVLLPSGFHEPI
jgi:PRTRC genetic system protein C